MRGRIQWRGRQLVERCEHEIGERIKAATRALWVEYRRVLGRPGPPHSRPGEPPRKITGFGQANVYWHYDSSKKAGYVGVGDQAWYMMALDRGMRFIAPRPWVRRTWDRMIPVMRRILSR